MIWILTSVVDGVITTTIHKTEAEAVQCLRDNFDSEPADFAHLDGAELAMAIEVRDEVLLALDPYDVQALDEGYVVLQGGLVRDTSHPLDVIDLDFEGMDPPIEDLEELRKTAEFHGIKWAVDEIDTEIAYRKRDSDDPWNQAVQALGDAIQAMKKEN